MTIAENLEMVRHRIHRAAEAAGRDASDVTLVAVSKRHPGDAIREAYAAGQRHFGENYVQELLEKRAALTDLADIEWHFIGHLQRNKVRKIVGAVALIETVDSLRLLEEVSKRALGVGSTVDVLLQVKLGDEPTKSGCRPEDLDELLRRARSLPGVSPRGLMVIPPFELDAEQARRYFREFKALRDGSPDAAELPVLSMGMSHDFEVAISEGATMVRVGTAIFGPR